MLLFVQDVAVQGQLSAKAVADEQTLKARVASFQRLEELLRAFSADSLMALGSGAVRVMVLSEED